METRSKVIPAVLERTVTEVIVTITTDLINQEIHYFFLVVVVFLALLFVLIFLVAVCVSATACSTTS